MQRTYRDTFPTLLRTDFELVDRNAFERVCGAWFPFGDGLHPGKQTDVAGGAIW